MDRLEVQRFAMQLWPLTVAAFELPRKHGCVGFVVAKRLALRSLMFLAKVRSGRFVAFERIDAHQLGEFQEIGNASSAFQRLIEILVTAGDPRFAPELFSERRNLSERFA